MPKTKFQGIIFGIIMSITMAFGMEMYNTILKDGVENGILPIFINVLKETTYMFIIVFAVSNLYGNRIAHKLANKILSKNEN